MFARLATLVPMVVLLGCSAGDGAATVTGPSAPQAIPLDPIVRGDTVEPTQPSGSMLPKADGGHARMVAVLRQVAEQSAVHNPFLGAGQLTEIETQLASLPPIEVPDLRRWLFNGLAGKHKLRLGHIEEAIEHYKAAHDEWLRFPDEIPADEASKTHFELGVAYLRLGETQNCALRHTSDSCIFPIGPKGQHALKEGSEQAMVWFGKTLDREPPDSYYGVKARWLYNIAAMTLGRYPSGVPEKWRMPPERFHPKNEFPRFRNIAPRLGLHTFDLAGGAVVEDFDGDLDLDIVVSTSDTQGPMHYFRNNGDGSFKDVTREAGLAGLTGGLNMIQADYNNDGFPDLFVLRGGWWRHLGRHPNSLLRNNGDGTFVDVTFEAGLGKEHYPTQTAAWADYDLDGDLDLYIGNEQSTEIAAPGQLFRNNGNGTFTDVAGAAGVRNERYAKAVSWGDYDNDGDPDLYVSNMPHANRLYRNNGNGTFTDIAETVGVHRPYSSFPAWFWDYDNDGALDLLVTGYGGRNLAPDLAWTAMSALGIRNPGERARLYKGDGKGAFREVGAEMGLERITMPMGSNFGDLDGDGFLDFYLGTGYPQYDGVMPNVMYRNRAGRGFEDVTLNSGFGHLQKGHGVVFADLDQDGDQDVFEQMGGAYPGDPFSNALYENPGFGSNFIYLRLIGTRSNRQGIGARIRVTVEQSADEGTTRTIYRTAGTGGSFGANSLRQEIGIGEADIVREVEVLWPGSKEPQRFLGLQPGKLYHLTEGVAEAKEVTLPAVPFEGS